MWASTLCSLSTLARRRSYFAPRIWHPNQVAPISWMFTLPPLLKLPPVLSSSREKVLPNLFKTRMNRSTQATQKTKRATLLKKLSALSSAVLALVMLSRKRHFNSCQKTSAPLPRKVSRLFSSPSSTTLALMPPCRANARAKSPPGRFFLSHLAAQP